MAGSLFDSAPYRTLLLDREIGTLFTDTAILRAMLLALGATALAQSKAGQVPEISAKAIQRAALEIQVDPAALSADVGAGSDIVSALAEHFAHEMNTASHSKWLLFETSPEDIAASGLALRLRQVFSIFDARLTAINATAQREKLITLKDTTLCAYHRDETTRASLAGGLGLRPENDAHFAIAGFADWISQTCASTAPDTVISQAIAKQLHALNAAVQASQGDTTLQDMCLPQMCLGLGRVLQFAALGLAK